MAANILPESSLRLGRLESSRLVWAFVISVALHLFFIGGYEVGQRLHLWEAIHWPAWLKRTQPAVPQAKAAEALEALQREAPLMYVDVNPTAAAVEPPKDAKYYSAKSSKAANPDPNIDSNIPKITGTQTQITKTEDVPRSQAMPLQPAPATSRAEEEQEEAKPQSAPPPGALVMAKPADALPKDPGQAKQARPRTVKEALARQQQQTGLSGEKMKQEGGVKRQSLVSSLDVRATPFGAYDSAIIAAVQSRWYYLLDSGDFARDRTGKVVVEFRLYPNGDVRDVKVAENTVNELLSLLCQKAISDPAPYDKWPSDMRRMVGKDYREVRFTFYYN